MSEIRYCEASVPCIIDWKGNMGVRSCKRRAEWGQRYCSVHLKLLSKTPQPKSAATRKDSVRSDVEPPDVK